MITSLVGANCALGLHRYCDLSHYSCPCPCHRTNRTWSLLIPGLICAMWLLILVGAIATVTLVKGL